MPNQPTIDFIAANASGDVRRLALEARRHADVDMPYALDQIAGRQTARAKLPTWAEVDGIVYPPRLSMEQCSSEPTARHKADIARRLCRGGRIVDLTGGFGVDFAAMAEGFEEAIYVERNADLCDIARHNMPLLGLARAEVVEADAADYLQSMPTCDLIYIDPARRSASGSRTYAIADCQPDVAAMLHGLLAKAPNIVVKLSPMLDWHKAVADMDGRVSEVHIVAVGGECKEMVLVVGRERCEDVAVHCLNDGHDFAFAESEARDAGAEGPSIAPDALPMLMGASLHDAHAAVMKAGCFGLLCRRYGLSQMGRGSHLFVGSEPAEGFPGRTFRIEGVTTLNRNAARTMLQGISRANIATRNFPIDTATLRRRLRLADGGDVYIFATTAANDAHLLLICRKTGAA